MRPVFQGPSGHNTPQPWLMGPGEPAKLGWAHIEDSRVREATENTLCIVCGLPCADDKAYALAEGKYATDRPGPINKIQVNGVRFNAGYVPAPTFGHPECILKAAVFCPHLRRQKYVARVGAVDLTVDQLRHYVRSRRVHQVERSASHAA